MEQKENSGAIFKNSYKKEGDKSPDYKGTINCDGNQKDIALWLSKSKDGKSYFSVKLSEPYKKEENTAPKATTKDVWPQDLPFIVTILLAVGSVFSLMI